MKKAALIFQFRKRRNHARSFFPTRIYIERERRERALDFPKLTPRGWARGGLLARAQRALFHLAALSYSPKLRERRCDFTKFLHQTGNFRKDSHRQRNEKKDSITTVYSLRPKNTWNPLDCRGKVTRDFIEKTGQFCQLRSQVGNIFLPRYLSSNVFLPLFLPASFSAYRYLCGFHQLTKFDSSFYLRRATFTQISAHRAMHAPFFCVGEFIRVYF